MQAGNRTYRRSDELPDSVPVFPLAGALLLPGTQLPLNIFEPRYLTMFDDVLASHRLIGMVQPAGEAQKGNTGKCKLSQIGCLGRLVSWSETGDGRYMVQLAGVARYRITQELDVTTPYRQCRITPFLSDLTDEDNGEDVNRALLLSAFRNYLDAHDLDADWASVEKAGNRALVNTLSVMSPYGAAEKQALLEAPTIRDRAETLVAITEMTLSRESEDFRKTLQ